MSYQIQVSLSWAVHQPQTLGKADPHSTSVNSHCVHLEDRIPQLLFHINLFEQNAFTFRHQTYIWSCFGQEWCYTFKAPSCPQPTVKLPELCRDRACPKNQRWPDLRAGPVLLQGYITLYCINNFQCLESIRNEQWHHKHRPALTALAEWIKEALLGCSAENTSLPAGSDCFLT